MCIPKQIESKTIRIGVSETVNELVSEIVNEMINEMVNEMLDDIFFIVNEVLMRQQLFDELPM
jgi:uncharacterized lipoprotein YajG